MSKPSRNNLQEFCRVCLTYLPKRRRVLRNNSGGRLGNDTHSKQNVYDLSLLPQLREIFVSFASIDVSKENDEAVYPRSLCQSCYDKMIGLQEFRNLAINSAEAIYGVVNDDNNNDEVKRTSQRTGSVPNYKKKRIMALSSQGNDDDELLLSALVPLLEYSFKVEPRDYNEVGEPSSNIIPPNDGRSVKFSKPFVKNEIASECEEDDKGPPFNESRDSKEHIMVVENSDINTSNLQKENETDNADSNEQPHLKSDSSEGNLKCPICAKQVRKQVYLDEHIRGVHNILEKSFLCGDCQSSFKTYEQLRLHRIKSKHFVEKTFVCGINGCDASFKLNKTLKAHRKVEHTSSTLFGFEDMLELHQLQLNENECGRWICQICLKTFSTKTGLIKHQRRHAGIKSHICKVCGIGKVTKTELQTHMRTHIKNVEKFKCSVCPQEFRHKNAISRHVRVVHEGQRNFACSYCSKRFGTRTAQICHERLHTGERPYNCNICNKGFAQEEGLKSHMKSHDKKLRTHVCSVCSQRLITKKHLIDHEKRHKGAKPHICNICSRGYFSVVDLDVHKQSHTEEEIRDEIMRGGLGPS